MTNRYDSDMIDYVEIDKLREVLVGKRIESVRNVGSGYSKTIEYDLGGVTLVAHATDGGCACSNGCFSVDTEISALGATITNVEVEERGGSYWDGERDDPIMPGSISEGTSVIRIFVYTELGKTELVRSEGGDNGYYGWGFWLHVEPKVVTIAEGRKRGELE